MNSLAPTVSRKPFDTRRIRPYPRKPKKRLERSKVTIAAGLTYRDGVILCADSEMTLGDSLKYRQEKVAFATGGKLETVLTGAGDEGFMKMAWSRILEQLAAKAEGINRDSDVEKTIDEVVGRIYKRNIGALPREDQYGSGFTLLAAWCIDGLAPCLFKVADTRLQPIIGFTCTGMGEPLAKYASEGLYDPSMTLPQALALAAYVIYVAKEYVPKCGGFTSIVVLDRTGIRFDWDREIYALESYFHSFNSSVKPLFLATADESLADADFQRQADQFLQSLQRMREHKKHYPDLDTFDPG